MRCFALLGFLMLVASSFHGNSVFAADPSSAVVPGFARFHSDGNGDQLSGGRLLLGELNCTSCHATDAPLAELLPRKQAPILDQVGSRVRPEFIRAFLLDPQATKPGTTMPQVWNGVDAAKKREQVEALTHFLALTGNLAEAPAIAQGAKRGEQLFHQVGCVACHDARQTESAALPDSVPLGNLSAKYSVPSLQQFLADPLTVRPSGRMPNLSLNSDEVRDITAYLLKDVSVAPNLKFSYYEGTWNELPDFRTLKPKSTGNCSGFDLNQGRSDNFAMRFEGFLQIAKEGQYRFHLGSDDGSRLLIDGQEIAAVDGVHPLTFAVGRAFLKAGAHEIVVEYFEGGGQEELKVEIEGNGLPRQSVEFALSLTREPMRPAGAPPKFSVDPALAEKGKQLFGQLGCVRCHALGKTQPAADADLVAPPSLAKLKSTGGCLDATPRAGLPQFALSVPQRAAMSAALDDLRKANRSAPTPSEQVAATMLRMNCFACHARGTQGGPSEPRNKFFVTNQPEMGDEGRIPPPLTGVGAKLRADWLQQLLANGAKDRPYMLTRMPKFGTANVGHLVDVLAKADPEAPYQRVDAGVNANLLKSTGRKLVGAQGFSCIKCHTWGNVPSTGIQSISMTTMNRRLREAWVHQYLLEPQLYRAGTRMPAAWPMGQTLLPNVLGGDVSKQIHSVWAFLSDSDKAAMPLGLGRDPIELVAETEPVMYRNFIEGAGPRAIGVGYPEKVNLAFDANDLRLALVWQGAFIDASKHWLDRGPGFQHPLGDNVLKLPAGVSFARLASPESPWPAQSARELGGRFRGYEFDSQRRPIFLYNLGPVEVRDALEPLGHADHGGFRRTWTLTAPTSVADFYIRLASGAKIVATKDDEFLVDDHLRMRVPASSGVATLRKVGQHTELLLPAAVADAPRKISVELHW